MTLTLVTYYLQGSFPQYQSLIVAVILVLMVMGLRAGIAGALANLLRRRTERRAQA